MFNRVRAAIVWARLLKQYRAEEYAEALKTAAQYRTFGRKDSVFDALEATLLILTGQSEAAKRKFEIVLERLRGREDTDQRYVFLYTSYYLCLIAREEGCDLHRVEAAKAGASARIRRWLPLPPDPITL